MLGNRAPGGGSITRWLAERVAPTGTVLATDIDLTRIQRESLESRFRASRRGARCDPDGRVRPRARTPRTRAPTRAREVLRSCPVATTGWIRSSSKISTLSSKMVGGLRRPTMSCIAACIAACRNFFTGEAPILATRVGCRSCFDRRASQACRLRVAWFSDTPQRPASARSAPTSSKPATNSAQVGLVSQDDLARRARPPRRCRISCLASPGICLGSTPRLNSESALEPGDCYSRSAQRRPRPIYRSESTTKHGSAAIAVRDRRRRR